MFDFMTTVAPEQEERARRFRRHLQLCLISCSLNRCGGGPITRTKGIASAAAASALAAATSPITMPPTVSLRTVARPSELNASREEGQLEVSQTAVDNDDFDEATPLEIIDELGDRIDTRNQRATRLHCTRDYEPCRVGTYRTRRKKELTT